MGRISLLKNLRIICSRVWTLNVWTAEPGASPVKILQRKFYDTLIFKHPDWLINLISQSECFKKRSVKFTRYKILIGSVPVCVWRHLEGCCKFETWVQFAEWINNKITILNLKRVPIVAWWFQTIKAAEFGAKRRERKYARRWH